MTSPQGATWQVAPHLSGLSKAEGGFTTPLGWFGVKWSASSRGRFTLSIDVPEGTEGTVNLPKEAKGTVVVDGKVVRVRPGETLVLEGGSHRITVS